MSDLAELSRKVEVLERSIKREKLARKEAEQLLETKSRELFFANKVLEDSLNDLKATQSQLVQSEKMASVGQLAAGIAHEINNPVGFISSNLSTLRGYVSDLKAVFGLQKSIIEAKTKKEGAIAELESLEAKVDISFIFSDIDSLVIESVDGAVRVKKIISDLSEFSHLNGAGIGREDINALLDKTLNLARNQLKYDVEIVKKYGDLEPFYCDGGKLGQVFLNLIINAAHAMEDNSVQRLLTLETSAHENGIGVSISDTGTGIPEEKLARIFDPFFTTKEVGKGTGLGLHIVQDVVKSHGGSINVLSELGRGTTFLIEMPNIESLGKVDAQSHVTS